MRVVGGAYGSRLLKAVPGSNTRPTTDKIKESIFNLLGGSLQGGLVLDLYAGTGGLAIEAVSRGADEAVLCEKYGPALQTIRYNLQVTKEAEKFTLLSGDNRSALASWQASHPEAIFDYVFLDPPYAKQVIEQDILWLLERGLVDGVTDIVCETDGEVLLPDRIGLFEKIKVKQYGQTLIHIYRGSD